MDAPAETRDLARRLRRNMSLPEVLLWRALKGRRLAGLGFRRQHPIGTYVLDFYCAEHRLCVEVDGRDHDVGGRPARDRLRDEWLAAKGIRTLRLPARIILQEVDDAARTILAFLREADAPPSGELSRSD
ncbi:MAG: DUF559 domain-containing protein [Phenylobacterium sp.]|uniref:endonuclease domain-containing protein n=1 Tax=Phenylobacterium sp. TaxID=1871053 RepID=UPI0025DC3DC0|nr:DUF559 domain-containing protein [Phenylobacterium sp.]MBI1197657.1 DUF559 domain-containing protein [Phenylobacterium sp.]